MRRALNRRTAVAALDRWRNRAVLAAVLTSAACSDTTTDPPPPATGQRVMGSAFMLDGTPAADVTARLRWGDQEATATVASGGRFEVQVPMTSPAPVGVLTLEPGATATVHPAWIRVDQSELAADLQVVMLPRRWAVETGPFGGTVVDIDPAAAADARVLPSYWGFSFPFSQEGFLQTVIDSTRWVGSFLTWPGEAFPLPVALDRPGSTTELSSADSVALWRSVDALEAVMGRDLFAPARLEDLVIETSGPARTARGAILARVNAEQSTRGRGSASPETFVWRVSEDVSEWSGSPVRDASIISGDVVTGWISLREAGLFSDVQLVAHELMHALGLGHGCTWSSVQTYCSSLTSELPTAADLAHFEVLAEARHRERALGTRHGLLAAVFGQRVVTLGLPPIPTADVLFGPDNLLLGAGDWVRPLPPGS